MVEVLYVQYLIKDDKSWGFINLEMSILEREIQVEILFEGMFNRDRRLKLGRDME